MNMREILVYKPDKIFEWLYIYMSYYRGCWWGLIETIILPISILFLTKPYIVSRFRQGLLFYVYSLLLYMAAVAFL